MSAEDYKDKLRKQIYGHMNLQETDELLTIWRKGDHEEWTEVAFDVIQEILLIRLGEIPLEEENLDTTADRQTMKNNNSFTPTQDERIMAGLSHASVFLPMMGIYAPMIIWITQKEKSQYVAFQSLQAIVFQVSRIAVMFIGMGCFLMSFLGLLILSSFTSSSGNSESVDPLTAAPIIFPLVMYGVISIVQFFFFIYGIIGAIKAFQGKPFRYMIIGKRIDHFMELKQDNAVTNIKSTLNQVDV